MSRSVLDASALLALLQSEPGSEIVEAALSEALISSVNLSEVAGRLAGIGMSDPDIRETIGILGMQIVPFDDELAYQSGLLYPILKKHGLSLGDRACIALGMNLKLPVVTADQNWTKLPIKVQVRLIR